LKRQRIRKQKRRKRFIGEEEKAYTFPQDVDVIAKAPKKSKLREKWTLLVLGGSNEGARQKVTPLYVKQSAGKVQKASGKFKEKGR